ncbi:Archaeal/vacuolar-type H+-ATPase subunit E [Candidatus Methanoplasma termitum]|uniref:AtpE protein n=1 Tax=Candidatus Methanoplasma termitum TaxID=1577791 RepID=A0A0A7LDR2_9ARCH|nr:V-type ATP synthase subunit E family protein [Candidatus Methanoplasma termitum]AIZ57093.1 Archaeal/vacuolar-type H+-ATPase subunit E [Candidatus Methanoplasma termitum]
MALDNVTKEIRASADKRVSEIEAQTKAEVRAIRAEADAQISDMKAKEDKKLKEAVERLKRQELSSAELESKKIVLSRKREILAKVFETLLADLESAPRDVKLGQYKEMIESAKTVIGKPKVVISDKDNFTAKELGVKSVTKDPKIRAGLVLQSEDDTEEVDMQYETLLRNIWDTEIKALSDILFG